MATWYDVRISVQGADDWTVVDELSTPEHTFTGLTPETSYEIQWRACNEFGCSDWTESVIETTPSDAQLVDGIGQAPATGLGELTLPTILFGIGRGPARGLGDLTLPMALSGIGRASARGLGSVVSVHVLVGIGRAPARGFSEFELDVGFSWTLGRSAAVGLGRLSNNPFLSGFGTVPAVGFGNLVNNPFLDGIARAAAIGRGTAGEPIVLLSGIGQAPAIGSATILRIISLAADVEGVADPYFALPTSVSLFATIEGTGQLIVVSMGRGLGPIIGQPLDPLESDDHVRKLVAQMREGDTVRIHIPWGDVEGTTRLARVGQRRVETGDEQQRIEFYLLGEGDQIVEAIKDGEPLRYSPRLHQEASRQIRRSRRYLNWRSTRRSDQE